MTERVLLIVLDSCGCGGAPDAAAFGDAGADTLGHTASAVGGLSLPQLQRLGLGNLAQISGVPASAQAAAAFGRMRERSAGKDTTSGHWEIAGLVITQPFATFPQGFPPELIRAFAQRTGRGVLGNKTASGTEIIEELVAEQLRTGAWIVYTSVDSVFQLAAHEEKIPLAELYAASLVARVLCDPLRVGRVIARPFVGQPGSLQRTYNRRDFAMPPPAATMLDHLAAADIPVVAVGKIGDIFCGRGISESIHTAGNLDGLQASKRCFGACDHGLIFVNLIDFDFLYGHRRDAPGFAQALIEFDQFLPQLVQMIGPTDLMIITADHGNDPTYIGTDHTREEVPLLVYRPGVAPGVALGTRQSFADVADTILEAFGLAVPHYGASFLNELPK